MERTRIAFAAVLVLLLGAVCLNADTQSGQKRYVVPNTALAIPAGCNVKVRWVCPPQDPQVVDKASMYSVCLAVDPEGRPLIGYKENTIACPLRQYRFRLPQDYNSLACLDNGALLATTDCDLCFVVPPKKLDVSYDNVPNALYQPITNLPAPKSVLYAGVGNHAYFESSRKDGGSDVFLLVTDKSGLRRFDKVFSSKNDVNAVTGDGVSTFIAMGGVIAKIANGAVTKTYANPGHYIRGLAYLPGTGLFYCTDNAVGYVGAKGHTEFMATPDPRITLRNGTLYVLLSKLLGVLALDNVGDLKRFDRAIKETLVSDSKFIKVSSIRFFEAGRDVPEPADRKFATSFDHAKTRFVYCLADIDNLQYKKLHHKQTLSMELYRAGKDSSIDEQEVSFDVKPDYESMWGWVRFGSEDPGYLYPGAYTVKTYLNGVLVNVSNFSVTGEPSLLEASGHHDVAAVKKLLSEGANLNAANENGTTPLMLAAYTSDAEVAKLLIDAGADVNAKTNDGETALTMDGGTWKDDPSVADMLIKAGADINAQNKDGNTALHNAMFRGRASVVKLLLERGARTDLRDKDGTIAFFKGSIAYDSDIEKTLRIVELFLAHGVDVDAVDNYGNSALFSAIQGRNIQLVELLIKHGANVNATGKEYGVTENSPLGYLLSQYRVFSAYRDSAAKLRKIAVLLQNAGADLNTSEFATAYFRGVDQILDPRRLVHMLEMSEPAAYDMQPTDPALRKADIRGLLNAACRQISNAKDEYSYYSALNLCEDAGDRAKKWGLISGCPEIYFNMGIIYRQVGSSGNAAKYLKEYLDIAPTGTYAARARELMNQL